jgi:hypothetical protein
LTDNLVTCPALLANKEILRPGNVSHVIMEFAPNVLETLLNLIFSMEPLALQHAQLQLTQNMLITLADNVNQIVKFAQIMMTVLSVCLDSFYMKILANKPVEMVSLMIKEILTSGSALNVIVLVQLVLIPQANVRNVLADYSWILIQPNVYKLVLSAKFLISLLNLVKFVKNLVYFLQFIKLFYFLFYL